MQFISSEHRVDQYKVKVLQNYVVLLYTGTETEFLCGLDKQSTDFHGNSTQGDVLRCNFVLLDWLVSYIDVILLVEFLCVDIRVDKEFPVKETLENSRSHKVGNGELLDISEVFFKVDEEEDVDHSHFKDKIVD
jgi:hypothetical protein